MKHWLVTFNKQGDLVEAVECPSITEEGKSGFVVEATDRDEAIRLASIAYLSYAAEKTRERRQRYNDQGRCRCGRPRNVQRPDGSGLFRTCAVCQERTRESNKEGRNTACPRDGQAVRLERSAQTTRDRRAELRLETLLEVRKAFDARDNLTSFRGWLAKEIAKAIHARKVR